MKGKEFAPVLRVKVVIENTMYEPRFVLQPQQSDTEIVGTQSEQDEDRQQNLPRKPGSRGTSL